MVRVAGLDKIPVVGSFLATPLGMIVGGLAVAQVAGMVTGKWNLIPFGGRAAHDQAGIDHLNSAYPNSKSKVKTNMYWRDAALVHQIKGGIGGIRFGSQIQTAGNKGNQWIMTAARTVPTHSTYANYDASVDTYKLSFMQKLIHALRN
jgi:hypothetical protein